MNGANRYRQLTRIGHRQQDDSLFPADAKRIIPVFALGNYLREEHVVDDRLVGIDDRAAFVGLRPRPTNFCHQGARRALVSSYHTFAGFFPAIVHRDLGNGDLCPLPFHCVFLGRCGVSFQLQLRKVGDFAAQDNVPMISSFFRPIIDGCLLTMDDGFFRAVRVHLACRTFAVKEGVRRRRKVVTCQPRVSVQRVFRELCFTVFHLVVRPPQASERVRFQQVPRRFHNLLRRLATSWIDHFAGSARTLIIFHQANVGSQDRRDNVPFYFASRSFLVSCPARVVTRGYRGDFKLRTLGHFVRDIPIVCLFLSIQSFSVHAIRPSFIRFAMVNRRFHRLTSGGLVVSKEVSVAFHISIPQERVSSRLRSVFVANFPRFFRGISLSILPEEENCKVFNNNHEPGTRSVIIFHYRGRRFGSNVFGTTRPLFNVRFQEIRGYEVFFSISPFTSNGDISARVRGDNRFRLLPKWLLKDECRTHHRVCFLFGDHIQKGFGILRVVFFYLLYLGARYCSEKWWCYNR